MNVPVDSGSSTAPAVPRWRPTWASVLRGLVPAAVVCVAVTQWFDVQSQNQAQRNAELKQGVARLDKQIAEVATLRREIQNHGKWLAAAADLKAQQEWPLRLMAMVSAAHAEEPASVFEEVRETPNGVLLSGRAPSVSSVGEMAYALRYMSAGVVKVEVVGLQAPPRPRAGELSVRFKLSVTVKSSARPLHGQPLPILSAQRTRDPP